MSGRLGWGQNGNRPDWSIPSSASLLPPQLTSTTLAPSRSVQLNIRQHCLQRVAVAIQQCRASPLLDAVLLGHLRMGSLHPQIQIDH